MNKEEYETMSLLRDCLEELFVVSSPWDDSDHCNELWQNARKAIQNSNKLLKEYQSF